MTTYIKVKKETLEKMLDNAKKRKEQAGKIDSIDAIYWDGRIELLIELLNLGQEVEE